MNRIRPSACQICEKDDRVKVFIRLAELALARCGRCGFVFMNGDRSSIPPSPTDHFDDDGYMQRLDIERIVAEQVESLHSILRRAGVTLSTWPQDMSVLDIGCARGHYLARFRSVTGRAQLTGVDSVGAMTEWGRANLRLDLRASPIERIGLPPAHFGLITAWDVLEHLAYPRQVLAKLMGLLRPGGWLVLEVPSEVTVFRTLAKLVYRLSGGRLDGAVRELYHLSHLSYFTPDSLRTLLASLGGRHVTMVTKESHVSRFGLRRFRPPARIVFRAVAGVDRLLGTQAKLLCAVQRPSAGSLQ